MVNCGDIQNQKQCGNKCVGRDWFSKITFDYVNATQICEDQGYDGTINQCGGNAIQCAPNVRYCPGAKMIGRFAWKCAMKGR